MTNEKLDLVNALKAYIDSIDENEEAVLCMTVTKKASGNIFVALGDLAIFGNVFSGRISEMDQPLRSCAVASCAVAMGIMAEDFAMREAFAITIDEFRTETGQG